jgi:hypothetical protein
MLKSKATVVKTGYTTLNLDDTLIMSIAHSVATISGEDFDIGSACAAELDMEITNIDGSLTTAAFQGATVTASIGVLLADGVTYEYCPLGAFYVDSVTKTETSIQIKCYDAMVLLETPYKSTLVYPATLLQIAQDIAAKAGLTLANTTFPNAAFSVVTAPNLTDVTIRAAISWVAEAAACFVRVDRYGCLDINFYASTTESITANNYFTMQHDDLSRATITQVIIKQSDADTGTSVGSAGNTYTITGNPLLVTNLGVAATAIYNQLKNFVCMPFQADWQGNPALMAGDIITLTDRNSSSYQTILTESDLTYEGGLKGTASAKSLTTQAQTYPTATAVAGAVAATKKAAVDASNSAAAAQAAANGKNTVYYNATAPTGTFTVNDLWLNTAKGYQISYWNGTVWTVSQFGALAVTALDAGAITTGYLGAARIAAGSITATAIDATNLVVYKIASQSDLTVYATMTSAGLSLYKGSALSLTITADSGSNYASIVPQGAYNGLWLGTAAGSNSSAIGMWITASGVFLTSPGVGGITIGYTGNVTITTGTTDYAVGGGSGARWNTVPVVSSTGVMEVGQFLDFHESAADTNDYSSRLYSSGGTLITMGGFNCKGQLVASGSTYPQIYGNGTILQLANSSTSSAGVIIEGGDFRPATDNQLNLGISTKRWATVYAVTSTISTSDRTEKNTIEPLDTAKTLAFITALNPVSYKYNNGTSGRLHYGMISQDVEDEMAALGMTSLDFAGFIKSPKTDDAGNDISAESGYLYGLRYEEFIAPLIKAVQYLNSKINALVGS